MDINNKNQQIMEKSELTKKLHELRAALHDLKVNRSIKMNELGKEHTRFIRAENERYTAEMGQYLSDFEKERKQLMNDLAAVEVELVKFDD